MTNPSVNTPGKRTTMQPTYKYQPYPKAVYTAGLEDCKIIKSADEWPDGYYTHDEAKAMTDEADAPAEDTKADKKAEKEYRKVIMAYLDRHEVEYAKNLSTEKLEGLKVALDEHLDQQDQPNDDEQHTDNGGVSGV